MGAAGILGYRSGRKSGDGGERETVQQRTSETTDAAEPGAAQSSPAAGETKKQEKITGVINLRLRTELTGRVGNNIEIAKSNIGTGLEDEYDGLETLEQLLQSDKIVFEKIKGSILYMTTDKTKKIEKGSKGRAIIPINPKLTVKGMRHYLEDAAEVVKNL